MMLNNTFDKMKYLDILAMKVSNVFLLVLRCLLYFCCDLCCWGDTSSSPSANRTANNFVCVCCFEFRLRFGQPSQQGSGSMSYSGLLTISPRVGPSVNNIILIAERTLQGTSPSRSGVMSNDQQSIRHPSWNEDQPHSK
jgi:hypothetical protein